MAFKRLHKDSRIRLPPSVITNTNLFPLQAIWFRGTLLPYLSSRTRILQTLLGFCITNLKEYLNRYSNARYRWSLQTINPIRYTNWQRPMKSLKSPHGQIKERTVSNLFDYWTLGMPSIGGVRLYQDQIPGSVKFDLIWPAINAWRYAQIQETQIDRWIRTSVCRSRPNSILLEAQGLTASADRMCSCVRHNQLACRWQTHIKVQGSHF